MQYVVGDPQTTVLPAGKYEGQTVSEVGASQDGLRYLDYVRQHCRNSPVWATVSAYVRSPANYARVRQLREAEAEARKQRQRRALVTRGVLSNEHEVT